MKNLKKIALSIVLFSLCIVSCQPDNVIPKRTIPNFDSLKIALPDTIKKDTTKKDTTKTVVILTPCAKTNSGRNFQVLPKLHRAKTQFYKYVTHYSIALSPNADKAYIKEVLLNNNFIVEDTILTSYNHIIIRRDLQPRPDKKNFYEVLDNLLPQQIAYIEGILIENNILWIETPDMYVVVKSSFDIKKFFDCYLTRNVMSVIYASDWDTYLLRINDISYYDQIRVEALNQKDNFILTPNRVLPTNNGFYGGVNIKKEFDLAVE